MENGFESTNLMLPRKENKNMLRSVQIFITNFKFNYFARLFKITILHKHLEGFEHTFYSKIYNHSKLFDITALFNFYLKITLLKMSISLIFSMSGLKILFDYEKLIEE